MARRAGPGRPRASGLPRRERDRHTADADACPGGEGQASARHGPLGPLEAPDRDRRFGARRGDRLHEHCGGDQHRGVQGLRRAGVLAPALLRDRPGAIVVMDNLAAHKAEAVRKALDAARIAYRYLPAYSPDLNPIEPCWSKLKSRLRAKAARTLDALDIELGPALATVTAQDAQGWFRLCGYATPN